MLTDTSRAIRKPMDLGDHRVRMQRLRNAVASGVHMTTAAEFAGINVQTLAAWVREGQALKEIRDAVALDPDDDRRPSAWEEELITIAEDIMSMEAEAEHNLVKLVSDSAKMGETQDAKWLLERRWPARWGRRLEVTGQGGPLDVDTGADPRKALSSGLEKLRGRIMDNMAAIEDGLLDEDDNVVDAEVVDEDDLADHDSVTP